MPVRHFVWQPLRFYCLFDLKHFPLSFYKLQVVVLCYLFVANSIHIFYSHHCHLWYFIVFKKMKLARTLVRFLYLEHQLCKKCHATVSENYYIELFSWLNMPDMIFIGTKNLCLQEDGLLVWICLFFFVYNSTGVMVLRKIPFHDFKMF